MTAQLTGNRMDLDRSRDLRRVDEAVAAHGSLVYRLAYRVLQNRADAEDLAQGVFLQLLAAPEALSRVEHLRAWLSRVTLTRSISHLRSQARRRQREERWALERARRGIEKGEVAVNAEESLEEAVASLPDDLRIPLVLHFQEGLKYREVARACGCPAGTVAHRISRAKERLRERLGRGGALAAIPSLEEALRIGPPLPSPTAGFEARLHRSVEEALRRLGNGSGPGSGSGGHGASPRSASPRSGGPRTLAAPRVLTAKVIWPLGAGLLITSVILTLAWPRRDGSAASPARAPVPIASARTGGAPARARGGRSRRGPPHRPPASAERADRDGAADPESDGAGEASAPGGKVSISGHVRDRRGRPLEGAKVSSPIGSTATDSEGYYEIQGTSPNTVSMSWTQSLNGFQDFTTGLGAAVRPVSAGLSFQPIFDTIGGLAAVDLEGEKLEATRSLYTDQRVTLEIEQRLAARKVEADEVLYTRTLAEAAVTQELDQKRMAVDREFEIASLQSWISATGELRVVAEKEGYRVEVTEPLELGEEPLEVDLALEEISPLAGSVLSSGGAPVSDAEVAVAALAEDRTLPSSATQARTDEQGRFRFPTLPEGDYLLRVSAAGYQSQTTVVRRGAAIALRLQASGSARVLVLRSGAGSDAGGAPGNNDGEPIEGMEVEARRGAVVVARATSGADGVAAIADLAPGDYLLNALRPNSSSHRSRATGWISVRAGGESRATIEVARQVALAGRVIGPGAEAGDTRIEVTAIRADAPEGIASSETVPAKADGSFRFSTLPPGPYRLEARARRTAGRDRAAAIEVELPLGGNLEDVEIALALDESEPSAGAKPAGNAIASPAPAPATLSTPGLTGADLDPLFNRMPSIAIEESISLRSLLEYLEAVTGVAFAIDPELEASGRTEGSATSRRVGPTGQLLAEILSAQGLAATLAPGGIRIAPVPPASPPAISTP